LSDNVAHPPHYTSGGIETFDYLKAKLTVEELRGYCRGSVLKYLSRAGAKMADGGLEDYRKGLWYLERLVETYV
jgi:hypothetical protein